MKNWCSEHRSQLTASGKVLANADHGGLLSILHQSFGLLSCVRARPRFYRWLDEAPKQCSFSFEGFSAACTALSGQQRFHNAFFGIYSSCNSCVGKCACYRLAAMRCPLSRLHERVQLRLCETHSALMANVHAHSILLAYRGSSLPYM